MEQTFSLDTHFSCCLDDRKTRRFVLQYEICTYVLWNQNLLSCFNRSWRISTTPNTTHIFLIIFKLIQQSNMVILSCLAKKNQNLNSRKKSSVYYWKGRFVGVSVLKTQLSVINWTYFSSNSNFDFSSRDNSEWP